MNPILSTTALFLVGAGITALLAALVFALYLVLCLLAAPLAAALCPLLRPAVRWLFFGFIILTAGILAGAPARSEGAGAAGLVVVSSPPPLLALADLDLTDDQPADEPQVFTTDDAEARAYPPGPRLQAVVSPALAQLPEATRSEMGGWLLAAFALLTLVNLILPLIRGPRRYADHERTTEKLGEIKTSIDAITTKLDRQGSDQYNARRRMHRRINGMSNALSFFAGEMCGAGDARGERLRDTLNKLDEREGENE